MIPLFKKKISFQFRPPFCAICTALGNGHVRGDWMFVAKICLERLSLAWHWTWLKIKYLAGWRFDGLVGRWGDESERNIIFYFNNNIFCLIISLRLIIFIKCYEFYEFAPQAKHEICSNLGFVYKRIFFFFCFFCLLGMKSAYNSLG